MTEQQLAKVMGSFITHQRVLLGLTNEEGTWLDQHAKEVMGLLVEVVKKKFQEEKALKGFLQSCQTVEPVIKPKPTSSILELMSTVTVPATSASFVARDHFKLKKDGGIYSSLGNNFQSWFGGKTEDPIGEQILRCHKLLKPSVDDRIVAELGGEAKAETALSGMSSLMEKQKNGEDGVLLTNGYANVFYVQDQNGVLRSVVGSFCRFGWCVDAGSVEWFDGSNVFSCLPDEAFAQLRGVVLESSESPTRKTDIVQSGGLAPAQV